MLPSLTFIAVIAATANAAHKITLHNKCPFGVKMTLSNYPSGGTDYKGPPIGHIAASSRKIITVPDKWNGEELTVNAVLLRVAASSQVEFAITLPTLVLPF
ncbi:hypothetical protein C8J56DRAFT_1049450 [Mycena floridula]|nr:hypothetical protein C8J56DRAFT_1049450 [Mycena floridula]